jgi:hypothetical protein
MSAGGHAQVVAGLCAPTSTRRNTPYADERDYKEAREDHPTEPDYRR